MTAHRDDILTPVPAVAARKAYGVPKPAGVIDLFLDANEGPALPVGALGASHAETAERSRRYPSAAALEAKLAARFNIDADRVVVTAGGDDALDRACRAMLNSEREIIFPTPTFEMFPRYAELAGAKTITVPWLDGPYPTDEVIARVTERTRVIVVVTPNNPTGLAARTADIERLAHTAPHALVIADLAYVEFADEDPTEAVLNLANAIAVRTFSKSLGFAGLRVGYATGSSRVIGWLRTAGGPYPVSSPSLELASARLDVPAEDDRALIARVRSERERLIQLLSDLLKAAPGTHVWQSQGNFVLARFPDAARVHRGLGERGIAVRAYPGKPDLHDCLRITCPGSEESFTRLCAALRAAIAS